MKLKVFNVEYDITVTDGGTFYVSNDQSLNAKSLNGLKKKIQKAKTTARSPVPVEDERGRPGMVISRSTNRSYYTNYYIVKWEHSNAAQQEYGYNLWLPRTVEDRAALKKAESEVTAAKEVYENKSQAHTELLVKNKAVDFLNDHFST